MPIPQASPMFWILIFSSMILIVVLLSLMVWSLKIPK